MDEMVSLEWFNRRAQFANVLFEIVHEMAINGGGSGSSRASAAT